MGDPLGDLDAMPRQPLDLTRIVGQQADAFDTQQPQHFNGGKINALVVIKAQLLIGIQSIETGILQFIGPEFVDQPDPPSFLGKVEKDAAACLGEQGYGPAELITAITPQTAQQIAGEAFRVQTGQNRLVAVGMADNDGQMLDAAIRRPESHDTGFFGVGQGNARLGDPFETARGNWPIGYDVGGGQPEQALMRIHRRRDDSGRQHARQLGEGDGSRCPVWYGFRAHRQMGIRPQISEGVGQTRHLNRGQRFGTGDDGDRWNVVGQAKDMGAASGQDHPGRGSAEAGQASQGFSGRGFGSQDQGRGTIGRVDLDNAAAAEFGDGTINRHQRIGRLGKGNGFDDQGSAHVTLAADRRGGTITAFSPMQKDERIDAGIKARFSLSPFPVTTNPLNPPSIGKP